MMEGQTVVEEEGFCQLIEHLEDIIKYQPVNKMFIIHYLV